MPAKAPIYIGTGRHPEMIEVSKKQDTITKIQDTSLPVIPAEAGIQRSECAYLGKRYRFLLSPSRRMSGEQAGTTLLQFIPTYYFHRIMYIIMIY